MVMAISGSPLSRSRTNAEPINPAPPVTRSRRSLPLPREMSWPITTSIVPPNGCACWGLRSLVGRVEGLAARRGYRQTHGDLDVDACRRCPHRHDLGAAATDLTSVVEAHRGDGRPLRASRMV